MSLRLCFETRAPAGRIASSSTRSASLGEFWTQVDSSLAAVDALKTLGAPARGLPWTCRFVVISTFYFAYEIARYALSKRELRSRVNAHAPATTLRYRPKKFYYGFKYNNTKRLSQRHPQRIQRFTLGRTQGLLYFRR